MRTPNRLIKVSAEILDHLPSDNWKKESGEKVAWMSGSTRRVIEAIVDRLCAGEPYLSVMRDFPDFKDEHGYQPDLRSIEKLARKVKAPK